MVVLGKFQRVLYNNIHHVAFARELEEKEKNTEQDQPAVRSAVAAAPPPPPPAEAAAAEVRFSMTSPHRNPPELLVIHTSHIYTLFRYRRQHYVRTVHAVQERLF